MAWEPVPLNKTKTYPLSEKFGVEDYNSINSLSSVLGESESSSLITICALLREKHKNTNEKNNFFNIFCGFKCSNVFITKLIL